MDDHQERLKNKKCFPLFFPDPVCEKHLREALKKHFTLGGKKLKKSGRGGERKSPMVAESKTKPHEKNPSDMKASASKSQQSPTAAVNNRERPVQIIRTHAMNTILTQQ